MEEFRWKFREDVEGGLWQLEDVAEGLRGEGKGRGNTILEG